MVDDESVSAAKDGFQTAVTWPSRRRPEPMPDNIRSVQPGGGSIMRLELAWGRLRRRLLRRLRPAYVARMERLRQGHCPDCTHGVIDSRDLKYYRNCCGYYFRPGQDRFAWRDRLGLARMGLGEVVLFGGGLLAVAIVTMWWHAWVAAVAAVLALLLAGFFRDPPRRIPDQEGLIVAPADGTVDEIVELDECEPLGGPAVRIGIFLSIFSVHLNRVPDDCRVIKLQYQPGRFSNAMRRRAAQQNEQLWVLVEQERPPHRLLLVKQIAGAVARRIVCEVRPGQVLARGQKFGMIKFGSRTELYLPKEAGLCMEVQLYQHVRAGATVLARYAADRSGSEP